MLEPVTTKVVQSDDKFVCQKAGMSQQAVLLPEAPGKNLFPHLFSLLESSRIPWVVVQHHSGLYFVSFTLGVILPPSYHRDGCDDIGATR